MNNFSELPKLLSKLSTDKLFDLMDIIRNEIDCRADNHRAAIEQAINAALEDGFDVTFWVEGNNDVCTMLHDDNHARHIAVN